MTGPPPAHRMAPTRNPPVSGTSDPVAISVLRSNSPHFDLHTNPAAATPVFSATTLAGILGIAVKNAIRILVTLVAGHRDRSHAPFETAALWSAGFSPRCVRSCGRPTGRNLAAAAVGRQSSVSMTKLPTRRRCRPSRRSSAGRSTTPHSRRPWRISTLSCANPGTTLGCSYGRAGIELPVPLRNPLVGVY
jgi:hypothetical protein